MEDLLVVHQRIGRVKMCEGLCVDHMMSSH